MKTILKGLAFCTVLGALPAQADFIKTDWKVLGDARAVLDTESGYEWLSLTETKGLTYDDYAAGNYGGFDGFRLATREEINEVVGRAVGVWWITRYSTSTEQRNNFFSVFGQTGSDWISAGWYQRNDGTVDLVGVHQNNYIYGTEYHTPEHDAYRQTGHASVGLFLVSDGGDTLSSQNNPDINTPGFSGDINEVSDVSVSFGLAGLLFPLLMARRKQSS